MFTIPNIVMLKDIMGLPKDSLTQICTNLDLPSTGLKDDLGNRIWERIRGNRPLQSQALQVVKDRILGGKSSITWFTSEVNNSFRGARELIIANSSFNSFENQRAPELHELTSAPQLISAASGENEHEYYLRFVIKTGVDRDYYTEVISRPRTRIINVYINEQKGIVEVRSEPKIAGEVASLLFTMLQLRTFMDQQKVLAPFGNNVEAFADALGGEVIDTESKPDHLLEDFSNDQAEAIVDILSGLDTFFQTDDIDVLQDNLSRAKDVFGEDLLSTPFTAVILAGLQRVSMGSDKELRGQPLYDFLRPFLQHQSGFIRFGIPENGLNQYYTIRVGTTVNSIVFHTPATEAAIEKVRNTIIDNSN